MSIINCYSRSNVALESPGRQASAGGLMGGHRGITFQNCYSSGNVSLLSTVPVATSGAPATPSAGGIIGLLANWGNPVTQLKGIVVLSDNISVTIENPVIGESDNATAYTGHLVGFKASPTTVLNYDNTTLYYNSAMGLGGDSSGNGGITGTATTKTAADKALYTGLGWDFDNVWKMPAAGGNQVPLFIWQN